MMKIGTLQINSRLRKVEQNMATATSILENTPHTRPSELDLLVLPELAFTGYNFPSLDAIAPFLEPTTAGPSTKWAIETSLRHNCYTIVGYPEIYTDHANNLTHNYNSAVIVAPDGNVVGNYRKSFLYYTDETWASEGFTKDPFFCGQLGDLREIGLGICMDINPYQFTAPWSAYEFATCMLRSRAKLIVLSMAWLTRLLPSELEAGGDKPDMETVAYWLERFHPFIEHAPDHEVIVVFANRCGMEGGTGEVRRLENGESVDEGDQMCYAGSSCVMRFQGGNVRMYEKRTHEVAVLGKNEEGLLLVDTGKPARFLLQQKAV